MIATYCAHAAPLGSRRVWQPRLISARTCCAACASRPGSCRPSTLYDEAGSELFERITELAEILSDTLRAGHHGKACSGNGRLAGPSLPAH